MKTRVVVVAVVSLLESGGLARGALEPFGQETVETRPLRHPQATPSHLHRHGRPQRAHRHNHERGHDDDAHRHRSGAGHSHARRRHDANHAHHGGDGHDHGIETENLFGFTLGSDTEEKGAKGVALEIIGRLRKRDGTYTAIGKKLEFSYGVIDDISVAFGLFADYHRVLGVIGFDDVRGFTFNGVGTELRWRLAKRGPGTTGVTLHVEPSVQRVDELTGLRGIKLGSENKLILDRELITDRLFTAFNLIYELERMRENGSADWENRSKVGLAAAASIQAAPKLFLGGEARYLRAYEGLRPAAFLGEALYVGPTLFWHFAAKAWIAAAWNVQVAGHEAGNPLRLDLTNFEHHQARVKVGVEF